MIGILLNVLLFVLCARQRIGSYHRKGELLRELSLESAEAKHWNQQMNNVIFGLNLVPFCLLAVAGYRLCTFIEGIESTQHLRAQAATIFSRSDENCTISAVHHEVRVIDNKGLSDCYGSSTNNVFLRIGAGEMDDVEARCQGQYGNVAFTFDDYRYSFTFSNHVLQSRGERLLRPFKGTNAALTDDGLWVDHPRSSSTPAPSTYVTGEKVKCWMPVHEKVEKAIADAANTISRQDFRLRFQCGNKLCVKIFDPADDLKDPEWHAGELEYIM